MITYSGNSKNHNITNYENAFITKASKNYSYDGQFWIGNEVGHGIKFISYPEGYIEPNNQGGFDYVFQYKDHLGNIRLSYKDTNNNGSVDSSEIVEENNYYPFGLKHKGYNGVVNGSEHLYGYLNQEEQNELGLNWLTFRYRNYMPEIGRFFGTDPISEEYFSITNYQFAHNNPVWKIELEGLEGATTTGQGNDDTINHEPVKAFVGVGIGKTATKELVKQTGKKVVQESAKKSVLSRVFGFISKTASFTVAAL